ncbi:hypothetical protein BPMI_02515 [Candidatus Burkholderia pumila]|uniref:Lipoprotein n=1 Tax=Candidatus Burkholderia pumila TaxID=1090375 RepID=A0ABR5HMX7_9BURK|nr:hypothetical protein BPMI_02515 [Candidatus Burkholderia pumila]
MLAACGGRSATTPSYQQELFSSGPSPFAHNFDATVNKTCEAARRALLSQGFLTTTAQADSVDAFQHTAADQHVVVSFHVVCTAGENATNTSIAYVKAVQDGYALKKSDMSASVGLSVLGSLSLPIRSNNDAMVKISSETVPAGKFYDRFFSLMSHYLNTMPRSAPVAANDIKSKPLAPSLIVPSPETDVYADRRADAFGRDGDPGVGCGCGNEEGSGGGWRLARWRLPRQTPPAKVCGRSVEVNSARSPPRRSPKSHSCPDSAQSPAGRFAAVRTTCDGGSGALLFRYAHIRFND